MFYPCKLKNKTKQTLSTFSFMESLGTIVSFFSKKVKEKVDLIRELSLRASAKDYEKDHLPSQSLGLKNDVSVTESHPVELKVSKLQLIFFKSLLRHIIQYDPWSKLSYRPKWLTSPAGPIRAAGPCWGCIVPYCGWSWCWRVWRRSLVLMGVSKHPES